MGNNGTGEPIRVLVVDDDVVVRMLLSMHLDGLTVLEAARAAEGERVAREQHPDAVIVDVRLPDGDGLDLVRLLRVAPNTRQTPIIVVTAGHDPAMRQTVLKAGADEYLAKPFEPAALEDLLRRVISLPADQRRQRRDALSDEGDSTGSAGDLLPEPGEPTPRRWRRRRRQAGPSTP